MGAVKVYGRGFCFCNKLPRQTLIFSFSRFLTGGYGVHTSHRIIQKSSDRIPRTPTRKVFDDILSKVA
ncbi:MAG: hypothetical protein V7L12_10850 [Nostoc sp.]